MISQIMPFERMYPTVGTLSNGCVGWIQAHQVIVDQHGRVYLHKNAIVCSEDEIPKPTIDHIREYVRVIKHPEDQRGVVGIHLGRSRHKWAPTIITSLYEISGGLNKGFVTVAYVDDRPDYSPQPWEKKPEIDPRILCGKDSVGL
jgi:hypothetical protein